MDSFDTQSSAPGPADRELAAHLENTPLAVIAWDREGRVNRWSGQAERMFGWTAAEATGRHALDLIPPHADDLAKVSDLIRDLHAGRRRGSVLRNRNIAKGGRVVWCEWYNSVLFDDRGGLSSFLSLVLDVSDRIAVEAALGREELRLRQVLHAAGMIGWDWDYATSRVSATTDLATFFGLPPGPDYTTVEAGLSIVHADDREAVRAAFQQAVETGGEFRFHFRGVAPAADGGDRWFSSRGQALRGPDGAPTRIVAVTADITERKRADQVQDELDRQLLDAQKWESLGVLAGGVAHDFNNILTVILGSAGLAHRLLVPDTPAANYLEQIEKAAQRAAGLCREMMAYAGRGTAPAGAADLSRLVRESRGLLEVSTTRHARVRLDLADGLPAVRADEEQVRRVLVNLVMNAGEALGEGGEVVICTGLAEVTGAEPADHFRLAPAPGMYIRLVVGDDGAGIAPAVLARLFDPFFTTKFPGRGLGLAAVLGIVKTHRGGIRVETAPGRGTTFEVYWPPAGSMTTLPPADRKTPPEPTSARPTPAASPDRSSGGVALVVDDEMYVREVAASTLEDLGYVPLLAGDGRSGLDLFRANRDGVRVVVLDAVMPGLTGDEVLAAIRAEAPDTPAVLISGYPDRHPKERGGRTVFLQKPFHAEELAAAVERVIAGGR